MKKISVAVIGAGAGGIVAGVALQKAGYDFTIFDAADGFGGTWRHNTYPGAACDVPSHLYSFSFALNPRWSKTYANQPEILSYLEKVAYDHRLQEHLLARTRIERLTWSDEDNLWTVHTDAGEQLRHNAVVVAVGMLDVPLVPELPGTELFTGHAFHSARWDHSISLEGQRVGSIGTGASAVQYVPAIAGQVASLTVFQRTPIWVSPRHDVPFTEEQMQLFEAEPDRMSELRDYIWQQYENSDFSADGRQTAEATELALAYLHKKVADPELRDKLTPRYPVGCKRPLLSRDWFPTLTQSHVRVETAPVLGFFEDGLITADGQRHELDAVIYGTGFRASDYLSSLEVQGIGGRTLSHDWADGAEAYLGTTISGYPNLFTMFGPNTNGVNSILFIHEAQISYVMSHLAYQQETGANALNVRPEIQAAYNRELQRDLQGTVWLANCNNYYRHQSGKVVTQLPYSGGEFARRTKKIDPTDYQSI